MKKTSLKPTSASSPGTLIGSTTGNAAQTIGSTSALGGGGP